jgi:hypothetical protein
MEIDHFTCFSYEFVNVDPKDVATLGFTQSSVQLLLDKASV